MIKAGITGIIGSGKTTVARVFESLNVPVFYADQEARKMYGDKKVVRRVTDALGTKVAGKEGGLDFSALAQTIFSSKENLSKINAIIHPLVYEALQKWIHRFENTPLLMYESALLFESGFHKTLDVTICVSAPEQACIQRVMHRDNISKADILRRMHYQYSDSVKCQLADHIIINDDKHMVIPQVLDLHHTLLSLPQSQNT